MCWHIGEGSILFEPRDHEGEARRRVRYQAGAVCRAELEQVGAIVGAVSGKFVWRDLHPLLKTLGFSVGRGGYGTILFAGRLPSEMLGDRYFQPSFLGLLDAAAECMGMNMTEIITEDETLNGAAAIIARAQRPDAVRLFASENPEHSRPWEVLSGLPDALSNAAGLAVADIASALPLLDRAPLLLEAAQRAGFDAGMSDRNVGEWSRVDAAFQGALRILSPRPEDRTRFVVAGLLPAGKVALLVGAGGSGKGTLALQLGAAIGSGEMSVLGREIDAATRGGSIVYLSAEDDDAEMSERMGRLVSTGMSAFAVRIIPKRRGTTLAAALTEAGRMPDLAAVVVDPATGWMADYGSANEDKPVSTFMDDLRVFAEETGAAVLVIHHPAKPSRQRSASAPTPRGSQVWVDRARVVLLFEQAPGGAVVTVQKSNLRGAPKGDVLRLAFDPETGMHHPREAGPVTAGKGAANPAVAADAGAVLPAVVRLAADGQKVTRTGKGSLYGRRLHRPDSVPEVDGWPRARCEAAVEYGIAAGMLRLDPAAGIGPV